MRLQMVYHAMSVILWGTVLAMAGFASADEPWEMPSDDEIESRAWQQQAETLEEFTQRLKDPYSSFGSAGARLSDQEIDEAVSILQSRYPLVSIRARIERMQPIEYRFRDQSSSSFASDPQPFTEVKPTGVISTGGYSYRKVRSRETTRVESLRLLHSSSVKTFISNPGNGLGRFPVASPYQLPLFESKFPGLANDIAVPSEVAKEPVLKQHAFALTDLVPDKKIAQSGNAAMTDADSLMKYSQLENTKLQKSATTLFRLTVFPFASRSSTGYFKNPDEVAGFEAHQVRMPGNWEPNFAEGSWLDSVLDPEAKNASNPNVKWRVNRVQLVSLLLHQRPSVYLTDNLPNMEQLSSENAPVRDVDAFEASALESFEKGKDIVLQASANRIRMVGSIRTSESCINCHSNSEVGDVLGAFSYEILRSPFELKQNKSTAY